MLILRKLLRAASAVLLIPILLFEEWGWEPLAALVARLARHRWWAALEAALGRLPPWAAVTVFCLPVIALLPVKLLALLLFSRGHVAAGVGLLLGAKVVGTAVVARLFQLTLPSLMAIGWFARWYPRWKTWKDQVLGMVRRSAPWQGVLRINAGLRRALRGLRRRWRAMLH